MSTTTSSDTKLERKLGAFAEYLCGAAASGNVAMAASSAVLRYGAFVQLAVPMHVQ
jgi:hypothetical protein